LLADDGQIVIDKTKKYQQEKGQWGDPEAFLKV
jgi:cytochrome b6-f complex iron-sulfur subunit